MLDRCRTDGAGDRNGALDARVTPLRGGGGSGRHEVPTATAERCGALAFPAIPVRRQLTTDLADVQVHKDGLPTAANRIAQENAADGALADVDRPDDQDLLLPIALDAASGRGSASCE